VQVDDQAERLARTAFAKLAAVFGRGSLRTFGRRVPFGAPAAVQCTFCCSSSWMPLSSDTPTDSSTMSGPSLLRRGWPFVAWYSSTSVAIACASHVLDIA
jgi:hypothetical protein